MFVLFCFSRYVSPPEAMWRLNEYPIQKKSHSIERLPIHLPDQKNICFKPEEFERAIRNAANIPSKLEAWFYLNQTDESARQYKYVQIPEFYWFDKGEWKKRKKLSKKIGRLYMVSVKDRPRYFLRTLLVHLSGAKSYEDLLTVNEILYSSFEDAAIARNLLATDDEWYNCLQEACSLQMPSQLRRLFAYICLFCEIKKPEILWNTFKDYFLEDYFHKSKYSYEDSLNLALNDIENVFSYHGKKCVDFLLPTPHIITDTIVVINDDVHETLYAAMNEEQKLIIDDIVERIVSKRGGLIFINGAGGTGKTFLYKYLCYYLKSKNEIVLPVAWTGIAATLLPNGTTAHYIFKFPVPLLNDSVCYVHPYTDEAKRLIGMRLLHFYF